MMINPNNRFEIQSFRFDIQNNGDDRQEQTEITNHLEEGPFLFDMRMNHLSSARSVHQKLMMPINHRNSFVGENDQPQRQQVI